MAFNASAGWQRRPRLVSAGSATRAPRMARRAAGRGGPAAVEVEHTQRARERSAVQLPLRRPWHRVGSHCHFVRPLVRFIPDSRRDSGASLFL
jgi:hypothetical protein